MEGLFGQGEFSVDGEGNGKKTYSNRAFPFVSKESCEAVEENGLKEVPVLIEDAFPHREEQEEGSWEERCLLLFRKFIGFSVEDYEDKIINLVKSISEKRITAKGKGFKGQQNSTERLRIYNGM